MLALLTDHPDPMAEMRRLGVDARLAWHADDDGPALVLVDAAELDRLQWWLEAPAVAA
jgi:hypothetical protein